MAIVLLDRQLKFPNGPGFLHVNDEEFGTVPWDTMPAGAIRAVLTAIKHRRFKEGIGVYVDGSLGGWIPDGTAATIHDLVVELGERGVEIQADVWNSPGEERTLMVAYPSNIVKQLTAALR